MHSIRCTCSSNVFQITTLNFKQFTRFDIAYHTRVIYKPIHIKHMCLIFVLKKKKKKSIKNRTFLFRGQYIKYNQQQTNKQTNKNAKLLAKNVLAKTILSVNEKLPLLTFQYFKHYKRNLESYFTFVFLVNYRHA